MPSPEMTIGRLANAASVSVETIRYYQQRRLLPVPAAQGKAFRTYPPALVGRVQFIRRAQELGFSLDEIAELLALNDGAERMTIRQLAGGRLATIRSKIADLQKMESALATLLSACEHTEMTLPCPIIEALTVTVGR